MKAIYKLHYDCGRQGTLHGVFIEDTERVDKLIESGAEIYFGEVLGKHSEICGPLEPHDVTLVSTDPATIKVVEDLELTNGCDPVQTYIWHEEDQGRQHIFSKQPLHPNNSTSSPG